MTHSVLMRKNTTLNRKINSKWLRIQKGSESKGKVAQKWKSGISSVIRFLFLERKLRSEIKERLHAMFRDTTPSMATVKNRFNEFKHGHTSVFDDPRPGFSKKTTCYRGNNNRIRNLVLADSRLKVRQIAETVGISNDRVAQILQDILDTKKLSARWVPSFAQSGQQAKP
ncbi:hypothetical protein D910_04678 [Dendroctonus ponderosae]|uniref:Mos1 transposase HTH domain-containing protein n=1 Tax=Dendroctonus ponderosae TaxID=77166 RepID=U4U4L0_DENPD|nr:hypothetical protein D910_04678 [Dendroctonus ponderosae]